MFLSGPPDSPGLGPPVPLVPRLTALAERVERSAVAVGGVLRVDPLERLTERAGALGLSRRGSTSCGGASRLLRTADGWIALSLARPEDVDLVPAWLESDGDDRAWDAIARSVASKQRCASSSGAVSWSACRSPCSPAAPRAASDARHPRHLPSRACRAIPRRSMAQPSGIVQLGTLSSSISARCGQARCAVRCWPSAGVAWSRSSRHRRPDGARGGSPVFFDRMNGQKRSVALDLRTDAGVSALQRLLEHADVVIEASRPRALAQLGIDPLQLVASGPRVWVSITGHGYRGTAGRRIGFGDDAAVAGGLVVWQGSEPYFCCDAIADPISGITATAAVLSALVAGGRWHLDVAMSTVAADMAGPTVPVPAGTLAKAPRAPVSSYPAPVMGADTQRVLDEIGHR